MDLAGLSDEGIEVWVSFNDAEVLLAYVGLDGLLAIRQRASTSHWAQERQGEPEERLDHAEANRLLGRAAVRGWRGFTLAGEDFPYSPENADLLMLRWSGFARFVGEVALDLVRLEEERLAASKKKSLHTSVPDGTFPE